MEKKLLTFTLITFTLFCFANHATISGTVTDNNGQEIPFSQVALTNTNYKTLSDIDGHFSLSNVPYGNYNLVIDVPSFLSFTQQIEVAKPTVEIDKIKLQESTKTLNEVIVEAQSKSESIEEQSYNVTSIDMSKYENSTQDLNQILNQSSGINIRETGGLGSSFDWCYMIYSV